MADILPVDLFKNYSSDNNNIVIPIASLNGLTAANANANNGDGRELIRAIITQIFKSIQSLDSVSKPTKIIVTCSNPAGVSASVIRQSYTFSFDLTINSDNVRMSQET